MKILATAIYLIFAMMCCDCFDEPEPEASSYTEYEPVYVSRTYLEESIISKPAQSIFEAGKLYIVGDTMYVVEKLKGVHLINNSDPEKPFETNYIEILGCIDIAVKNNILYADNAVDLVAIDLSNLPSIQVVSRHKNIFPAITPPDLSFIPFRYLSNSQDSIIVDWIKSNR